MESESGSENASEKSSVKGDEMEETLESKTKPEEVCIKLICICFEQKIQHASFLLTFTFFQQDNVENVEKMDSHLLSVSEPELKPSTSKEGTALSDPPAVTKTLVNFFLSSKNFFTDRKICTLNIFYSFFRLLRILSSSLKVTRKRKRVKNRQKLTIHFLTKD